MTNKSPDNSQADLVDFVDNPENIKKAVEGSMEKRLDNTQDDEQFTTGEFPVCECCGRQFIDPVDRKLCRHCSSFTRIKELEAKISEARRSKIQTWFSPGASSETVSHVEELQNSHNRGVDRRVKELEAELKAMNGEQ